MGRAGSPIQKGNLEIMIFHSFARSNYFVQLKYRFSPPPPVVALPASTFDFYRVVVLPLPLVCLPTPCILPHVRRQPPIRGESEFFGTPRQVIIDVPSRFAIARFEFVFSMISFIRSMVFFERNVRRRFVKEHFYEANHDWRFEAWRCLRLFNYTRFECFQSISKSNDLIFRRSDGRRPRSFCRHLERNNCISFDTLIFNWINIYEVTQVILP